MKGIPEHIVDGKLHLKLKDFLELVLKNSTAVNLTRLDVYTAADQVEAAKAVYDPTLSFGFNTFRSVAPQSSQLSGATTLSNLTQNSFLNYQQTTPSGPDLQRRVQCDPQFQQQLVQFPESESRRTR